MVAGAVAGAVGVVGTVGVVGAGAVVGTVGVVGRFLAGRFLGLVVVVVKLVASDVEATEVDKARMACFRAPDPSQRQLGGSSIPGMVC